MPTADGAAMPEGQTERTPSVSSVPASELSEILASMDAYSLLDVRERGEYALGHIPNACPVPRGLIEVLAPTLFPWHSVPVIVYSNESHRSGLAARTLTALGYEDVRIVDGGIEAWRAAGNEPEEGVNVFGKAYGEKVSTIGGVQQLEPDDLAALQEDGSVVLLDARTNLEYLRGHIPGAVNVPGGELPVTLLSMSAAQRDGKTVVVHCAGRTRSILGARLVMDLGFDPVFALRNGTMAWRMSGRHLEYSARTLNVPTTSEGAALSARFAEGFVEGQGAGAWSATEVTQAVADGGPIYVLDVRQDAEFLADHIPGAVLCPVGQLANGADEVLTVRGAQIVCYSTDETRAQVGAGMLRRIGYPRVGWLRGGFHGWQAAGLLIAHGRPSSYPPALEAELATCDLVEPEVVHRQLTTDHPPALIDVRRSSEYALGHIASSRWVPRGDLERRLDGATERSADIVLVSDRGIRAALAARTAKNLGFERPQVLAGGVVAWQEQGHELTEGLDGADVSLREAKEDAELVAPRPRMLERDVEDMVRYLDWEEKLGHAFEQASESTGH